MTDSFEEVYDIVTGRCSMCHAREPVYEGIHSAPKHVFLETQADVTAQAKAIFIQSGVTHAMPPANITLMEETERAKIRGWFRAASQKMPMTLRLN